MAPLSCPLISGTRSGDADPPAKPHTVKKHSSAVNQLRSADDWSVSAQCAALVKYLVMSYHSLGSQPVSSELIIFQMEIKLIGSFYLEKVNSVSLGISQEAAVLRHNRNNH